MKWIMWVAPLLLTLGAIGVRAWRTYRSGLFVALLQLLAVMLSAVVSFLLTRALIDPGKVEIFGLGEKLVGMIRKDFFLVDPGLEDFIRALPTAVIALIAFTVFFEILNYIAGKAIDKLNEKNSWNEKFLCFPGNKKLALIPGALSALVGLLVDLVIFNGMIGLSANALTAAEHALDNDSVSLMAEGARELADSPVIRVTDAMGCRWAFDTLTMAQRNGKPFSVGKELMGWAEAFAGLDQVMLALPTGGHMPNGDALRALPEQLAQHPETIKLIVGILRAYRDELESSDAIGIISQLLGVSSQQFEGYLAQIEVDNVAGDMVTFCNIAAMVADRGLFPQAGEYFDSTALTDDVLKAQIHEELLKNETLAGFFCIVSDPLGE